jgi:hypothetical protein
MYLKGQGVEVDLLKGEKLILASAEQGYGPLHFLTDHLLEEEESLTLFLNQLDPQKTK